MNPELLDFLKNVGAISVTTVAFNTVRHMSGWGPRWFGGLLAGGTSLGALFLAEKTVALPLDRIATAATLGGLLVYAAAFGVNTYVAGHSDGENSFQGGRPPFWDPW
jgi:hypothetical protein